MIYLKESKTIKLPGTSSIQVTFDYRKEIVDTIKQVPNAIYHKTKQCWEIPLTSLSRAIDLLINLDQITLDLLEEEVPKTENNSFSGNNCKTQLYPYQLDGINYGLNHDGWLLLDAPGLGKSLQMIYLAQERYKRGDIEHCLVICGVNTLKHNWKREILKHSDLSCMILGERVTKTGKERIGSVAERIEDLMHPIDEFFVITNIETLRNTDVIKVLNKGKNKFDMVVLDEAHCCKSPTAQQSKGLLKIDAKYKIAMTGTILTNSPLDAYLPLKWIGADNSTYTNFKYYYGVFSGPFNNILTGYKNVEVLKDHLNKCSLRRTNDLLDLPEKNIIHEVVTMDDKQATFYSDIVSGIVDQVDKVDLNTSNLLSMVTRLRQATACPSILTTEDIPSSKIARAVDLAKQIIDGGDKVVIFSTFKDTLNAVVEELKEYSPLLCTGDIDDSIINKNIESFQGDAVHKVMCATTAKMGTGVTLTAANYAIFLDTPWTAALCEQCEDRIHRIGSKKPVFIYYLWTEDTVDERVREIVEDKEAISNFIVDDKMDNKTLESLKKYIMDLK